MQKVDLKSLSPEQIKALKEEIEQQEKAEKERIKKNREQYKDLVQVTVASCMKKIQEASSYMSKVKTDIYNDFGTLISMKKELYDIKDNQQSHSFTNEHGDTIELGFRVIDNWDDTVHAGIEKVRSYMDSLATDEKSGRLVKMINNLLKKDAKGNLKANRVLDLQNLAEEINDPGFTEGVEIIRQAYNPTRSAYYVEAYYKDNTGKKKGVPLSLSSVDFQSNSETTNLF